MKLNELKALIKEELKKKIANEMLTLGNLKPSNKKAKPAYTDAEIKAMSVDQAKAALKKDIWDVPHNSGIAAKLKKKIADAEKIKNENQPATAPSKPATKPGVKEPPAKLPGKPKPRRTFEPKPGAKPAPKAKGKMNENEKKIVDDIVKRFRDKKAKSK